MEIKNEFAVNAPMELTWEALVDVPGIALCLPGAKLTGAEGDTYSGTVKVKVGPMTTEYVGTAHFVERDDTAHFAQIKAKGSEIRGGGTATALITTRLAPDGERTRVWVITDLTITGKVAQFGRGVIGDIAGNVLDQFAANLEAKLTGSDGMPTVPNAQGSSPTATSEPAALDAVAILRGPLLKRLAAPAAIFVLILVLRRLLRRRA